MGRTRACTKCGEAKPLFAFSKHRLLRDGYAYQCKECNAIKSKEWRNTSSGIYTNIVGRTKHYKRKTVYISKEDFIEWHDAQPRVCEYCGIKENQLHLLRKHFGSIKTRLTVDCKNNSLEYLKGNLTLACDKCNQVKNNILSYNDMKYIGLNFIRPKWENG